MNRKITPLILSCCFVLLTETAVACRFSGTSPIALNGFLARGYGQVSAVFAIGVFYLQLRRVGWKRSTLWWALAFVPLALLNDGWHYSGISGDCGTGEASGAYNMMFYLGAVLLWQIALTSWFLWSKRQTQKKLASRL